MSQISKIRISGVTYDIAGSGGVTGATVIEVTQAQYDALVSGGTVDPTALYIITDAQSVDISNYWTSAQTQSAITNAVSGKASQSDLLTVSGQVANKQDTLVSGTNIKTINNESILGSGNIDIQGGGGASYQAGTNISIDANNVIKCTIPISASTQNAGGIRANYDGNQAGYCSFAGGYNTRAKKDYSVSFGFNAETNYYYSASIGDNTKTTCWGEAAFGRYNNSISATTNFDGNSGNTLFSVGNGTANNARHNAFEIRQNGDIYITSGNSDIKLQDHLGGGGGGKAIEAGTNISITTGETADTINCTLPFSYEGDNLKTTVSGNSFVNYFHYGQIFGINNTLQGKNATTGTKDQNTTIIGYNNQSLRMNNSIVIGSSNNLGNIFGANKQNYVFGYSNTLNPDSTSNNIINNNFVIGNNNTINQKSNNFIFGYGIKPSNNDEFSLGKYNNSVSGSSTFGDSGNTLFSVGNGTADNARHNAFEIRQNGDIYCSDGTNDVKLQDTITATAANTTALGGLKLVKLTQQEYDALTTKDSNTLYVIV